MASASTSYNRLEKSVLGVFENGIDVSVAGMG